MRKPDILSGRGSTRLLTGFTAGRLPQVIVIGVFFLAIGGVLSGCASQTIARGFCDAPGGTSRSQMALCMTGSAYELARKKEKASEDEARVEKNKDESKEKEVDPRYKEWIP